MEKELGQPYVVVNVGGAAAPRFPPRQDAPLTATLSCSTTRPCFSQDDGLVDYTFSDFEMGGLAVIDETNAFVETPRLPTTT
jgi:hypothetical protein